MLHRRHNTRPLSLLLVAAMGLPGGSALLHAADQQPLAFENAVLSIRLSPRTPQQVVAFYEARGFPKSALDVLRRSCFVTVRIRNRSRTVLWLELENWRFLSREGEVSRLDRSDWNSKWEGMALPHANRSTFRWTLLPESRDLQADEPVGGNITLWPTGQPFAVEARFATGARKEGPTKLIRIDSVRCAGDELP